MRDRRFWSAMFCAMALLAGACSSSGDDDDGGTASGGSDGGSAPGAADGGNTTGVTDDTVKIGALVGDNAVLADLGFAVDLGDTEEQYTVFFDGMEAGGRTIELSFHGFNSIEAETQQAACISATQDEEVFATVVLGGLSAENVLCVTEQEQTPMLMTSSQQDDVVERSDGRFFSANSVTFNPGLASAVNALDEIGELDGKTIGVVLSDNSVDRSAVDDALIPALEARGHELAEEVTLPCDGAICDQYDAAVQRMSDAGVDAMFSTISAVSMPNFVGAGANIGFEPQYYAAPIGTQDIDVLAARQEANADQYGGALAVTPASRDWTLPDGEPDPFGQECNDRYTDETGVTGEWGATEDAIWGAVYSICSLADQLRTALDDVGEDLTQERFIEAMEAQSGFPTNSVADGSYGPDKHYAATEVNILEWSVDCFCWVATDGETFPIVEE